MEPVVRLVEEEEASGALADIYATLKKRMGSVPNTFKAMGLAPKFLEAMLKLHSSVGGPIPPKYVELIGVAVAAVAGCHYCAHAHAAGAKRHGATDEEVTQAVAIAAMMNAFNTFNKAIGIEADVK